MDDVNKTIPHLGALRGGNCLGSPLSGGPEGGTGIPPRRGVFTHRCTVTFLGLGMKMPPGRCPIFSIEIIMSVSRDSFFWTQNHIPKL